MRCRNVLIATVFLISSAFIPASPQIDLVLLPQFITPLGFTISDGPDLYRPGAGARIGALYSLPGVPWLQLGGDVGVDIIGTEATDSALTMIALHPMLALSYPLSETVELRPLLYAGYAQSTWDGASQGQASAGADLMLGWRLTPQLSLAAGAGYIQRFGLFEGARVFVGTTYGLGRGAREPFTPSEIRINPVFPILYQHYDHGPFGAIELHNSGTDTLSDVRMSFFVASYMDSPKTFARFERVRRGEQVTAELLAMFNNQILRVTEGERVTAEITVEYTALGRPMAQTIRETLHIHNRNALTWDDDRKAAAFVTARDPNILRYARNTAGVQDDTPLQAINTNFRTAMAMFESFATYGLTYVVDPQSAYEELSQDALALDFIQFPVQTLEYRAGDCDDLAILYNALLEAVGIETAFITTPGHIYSAFNLDMWPDDAERTFGSLENLIVADDAVWVPVEITALREGFISAWEIGARQWREYSRSDEAEIHLTHQAWQVYPAVASPGDGTTLSTLPDRERLLSRYSQSLETFINRSIYTREQQLLARIRRGGDTRSINALGVLYARHGLLDRAAEQFERIAAGSASARVNLGNIAYQRQDYRAALDHFERALAMDADNSVALLGTAMARHQLQDYDAAAGAYTRLASLDGDLAERYDYLARAGESDTARASGRGGTTPVTWDE